MKNNSLYINYQYCKDISKLNMIKEYIDDIENEYTTINLEQKFPKRITKYNTYIDYDLFNITTISEENSLMPWHVKQVNTHFRNIYKNTDCIKKIVDATAHIGVDSINFLHSFKNANLISFEKDKHTYDILCSNLLNFSHLTKTYSVCKLTDNNNKVQAYNLDFVENIDYIKNSDIVFIDAPWGGKNYRTKTKVSLYLHSNNVINNMYNLNKSYNIIEIVKKILISNYNVYSIILKVPFNYEFSNFEKQVHNCEPNTKIYYKNVYRGNSNIISFVLIFII
jgi:hypothetical protein